MVLLFTPPKPIPCTDGYMDYIMDKFRDCHLSITAIDKSKSIIPASNFADDPKLLHWRCTGRDGQTGCTSGPGPIPPQDSTHTYKRRVFLRLYPAVQPTCIDSQSSSHILTSAHWLYRPHLAHLRIGSLQSRLLLLGEAERRAPAPHLDAHI